MNAAESSATELVARRRRRSPRRAERDRTPIRQAVNVGDGLARALAAVGVADLETLAALGAPTVWRRLAAARPDLAGLRILYALGGAVVNVRWPLLTEQERTKLRGADDPPGLGRRGVRSRTSSQPRLHD